MLSNKCSQRLPQMLHYLTNVVYFGFPASHHGTQKDFYDFLLSHASAPRSKMHSTSSNRKATSRGHVEIQGVTLFFQFVSSFVVSSSDLRVSSFHVELQVEKWLAS